MDYQELLSLIDKLDQSKVAYLEYAQGNDKVVLSKEVPFDKESSSHFNNSLSVQEHTQAPQSIPTLDKEQNKASLETIDSNATDNANYEAIKSPIVGVVYLQPQPEAATYVNVGDEVIKGQTICIIEAMKLMNEIVAPFDGIIRDVLVENDNVVEFDQPLFKIEPK